MRVRVAEHNTTFTNGGVNRRDWINFDDTQRNADANN